MAIHGVFQHALVIAVMDKRKIRKVVKQACAERRRISLLIDVKIRKCFEEKVIKLVDVGAPNLWGHFKDGVLGACDEVFGKKRGISNRDTWWWNEEVKETVSRKKEVHKTMCQSSTEENKRSYESMKNKAVSKAMREKAGEALTELQNFPNGMSRLKGLKTYSNEVEGGRCMRGSGEKLCFSEKERGKVWKDYMEKIMNEESDWIIMQKELLWKV